MKEVQEQSRRKRVWIKTGAPLSCLAAACLMSALPANAIQFNPLFLKDKGASVDLRFFEKSNGVNFHANLTRYFHLKLTHPLA